MVVFHIPFGKKMKSERKQGTQLINRTRRKLLQGTALVGAATVTPSVLGKTVSNRSAPTVTGKLICKIYDPMKTLVLHNHSDKAVVISHLSQSAFMFDGSVVDCNTACLSHSIALPANQEVQIQFDKRKQVLLTHGVEEYRRIQSRVTRLHDGTRVIPFVANIEGSVATLI